MAPRRVAPVAKPAVAPPQPVEAVGVLPMAQGQPPLVVVGEEQIAQGLENQQAALASIRILLCYVMLLETLRSDNEKRPTKTNDEYKLQFTCVLLMCCI